MQGGGVAVFDKAVRQANVMHRYRQGHIGQGFGHGRAGPAEGEAESEEEGDAEGETPPEGEGDEDDLENNVSLSAMTPQCRSGNTSWESRSTLAGPIATEAACRCSMRSAWCSLIEATRPGTSSNGWPCAGRPRRTSGRSATRSSVFRYARSESPEAEPATCGVIVGSRWSPDTKVPSAGSSRHRWSAV